MFDFLLDPNVAYLVLVLATLATMMAVLTPGTGVLEIFTLFMWILSAYIIFNVPINFWALGLLLWMFDRDLEPVEAWIRRRLAATIPVWCRFKRY